MSFCVAGCRRCRGRRGEEADRNEGIAAEVEDCEGVGACVGGRV